MTSDELNEMRQMMGEDREIWANIEGFEGYEVSTYGNVRSYWKREVQRIGGNRGGFINKIVLSESPVKIMKPYVNNRGGYLYVNLTAKHKFIHRLVAETFIPNPYNKKYVDHIDQNKQNNHVSNLRFATRTENSYNTPQRESKSGIRGVRLDERHGSWDAYWSVDGKCYFKCFKTKEEAIEYRKKMVEEHYNGDFYTQH